MTHTWDGVTHFYDTTINYTCRYHPAHHTIIGCSLLNNRHLYRQVALLVEPSTIPGGIQSNNRHRQLLNH